MSVRSLGVRSLVCLTVLGLLAGCGGKKKRIEQASRASEMGRAKLSEGEPEAAVAELTEASRLDPDNAEITHLLGMAYWSKGNLLRDDSLKLEAEKLVKKSFEQRGKTGVPGEWHNNLGALYVDLQRWPDAVVQLKLALEDPEYRTPERPLSNLSKASLEQRKCAEAATYGEKALRVQPRFCMALINVAEAQRCLKKPKDALENFLKVTKIEECETWPEPYLKAGMIYFELKNKPKAREYLNRARKLDPSGPNGQEAEGLLRMMGN